MFLLDLLITKYKYIHVDVQTHTPTFLSLSLPLKRFVTIYFDKVLEEQLVSLLFLSVLTNLL